MADFLISWGFVMGDSFSFKNDDESTLSGIVQS